MTFRYCKGIAKVLKRFLIKLFLVVQSFLINFSFFWATAPVRGEVLQNGGDFPYVCTSIRTSVQFLPYFFQFSGPFTVRQCLPSDARNGSKGFHVSWKLFPKWKAFQFDTCFQNGNNFHFVWIQFPVNQETFLGLVSKSNGESFYFFFLFCYSMLKRCYDSWTRKKCGKNPTPMPSDK